jgi:hypothetical protein
MSNLTHVVNIASDAHRPLAFKGSLKRCRMLFNAFLDDGVSIDSLLLVTAQSIIGGYLRPRTVDFTAYNNPHLPEDQQDEWIDKEGLVRTTSDVLAYYRTERN